MNLSLTLIEYWGAQLAGRATSRWEGGGSLPCPFLKIKKKWPDFWKKGPDCVHPYVKFTVQNVVLTVSKRKNFKVLPCEAFFSGIFDKMFLGVS